MADARAPRLCVLIDADNVPAGYAEAIFEEIASLGEASVRRIYGDWSAQRLGGWAKKVAALGLVADQQFSNTKGKNASDIGLVIAAIDFLHSGLFDGFVLVSSDSDFTRLAARIREQGLDVYGIGEKKTPEAFRMACKRFIYVENLNSDEPVRETPPRPADQPEPVPEPPVQRGVKEAPAKAIPLIAAAMRAIDPEGEWYTLGQIGQFITQA
ncbi:MAG: NYN domain-containing protein, partial [Cereibacter changlensis]